jgi:uncharacterized damage-inducible protein DinB
MQSWQSAMLFSPNSITKWPLLDARSNASPNPISTGRPHQKSMKIGRLAGHLAELPGLTTKALTVDLLDFRAPGAPPVQPTVMTSRKQILEIFDKNVAAARAAIAAASDADMVKTFTLASGGKTIFSLPRAAAYRGFVMNHVIHHRGQLCVYLRLKDVPVPSIYGPSADEGQL